MASVTMKTQSGGDAGSAEGDFASCLVWASRPGEELPLLIIASVSVSLAAKWK